MKDFFSNNQHVHSLAPFLYSFLSFPFCYAAPTFADVDGDGDKDLIIGTKRAGLHYFQNVGTSTSPVFTNTAGESDQQGSGANIRYSLFAGEDPNMQEDDAEAGPDIYPAWFRNQCTLAVPTSGDLNGDEKMDLVVGCEGGKLLFVNNVGGAHFEDGRLRCADCRASGSNDECFASTGCDPSNGYVDLVEIFGLAAAGYEFTPDNQLSSDFQLSHGPVPMNDGESAANTQWNADTDMNTGNNNRPFKLQLYPALFDMDDDGDLDLVSGLLSCFYVAQSLSVYLILHIMPNHNLVSSYFSLLFLFFFRLLEIQETQCFYT